MKRFTEHLIESVLATHGSLGIPRKDMPQIMEKDIPDFLRTLRAAKITTTDMKVTVNRLKPTQKEINTDRVKEKLDFLGGRKAGSSEGLSVKPFIISKDHYILDGHHQWMAQRIQNPYQLVDVHLVNLPMAELLGFARGYRKTSYKNINGEVQ